LGGVFAPVTQELFLAAAGRGTTLNGVPVKASAGHDLKGAKASGPKRHLDFLMLADRRVVSMPRIGSLALRLSRVAHGGLDIAFAGGNSHDWDLAAADLLVHEAGGAMTSLAGRTLIYNRPKPVHSALVAAGCDRHAMLIKLAHDRLAELA
jgi:myo-inositol-1(or 4)-monophosphatase